MSSDDPQAHASWPLEEQASSQEGRPLTRGMRPLIYELFVLGELMVQSRIGRSSLPSSQTSTHLR